MDLSDKKNIKSIIILCLGIFALYISTQSFSMGENVLFYELVKSVIIILFAGFILILLFIGKNKTKKIENKTAENSEENLETTYKKTFNFSKIKSVIGIILFVIILIAGIRNLINCIKDYNVGMVQITLSDTEFEHNRSSRRSGRRSYYTLEGIDTNGEKYVFRVKGVEQDVRGIINDENPEIVVTFYPYSKTLVQIQIHASTGVITLPEDSEISEEDIASGEVLTEMNDGKTSNEETTEIEYEYVDVSLDELELPEYKIGENYFEVQQRIAPLISYGSSGFTQKTPLDDDYSKYKVIMDELKSEYEFTIYQDCVFLFKDDIVLVLVYHKDNQLLQDIYAVRVIGLTETTSE